MLNILEHSTGLQLQYFRGGKTIDANSRQALQMIGMFWEYIPHPGGGARFEA